MRNLQAALRRESTVALLLLCASATFNSATPQTADAFTEAYDALSVFASKCRTDTGFEVEGGNFPHVSHRRQVTTKLSTIEEATNHLSFTEDVDIDTYNSSDKTTSKSFSKHRYFQALYRDLEVEVEITDDNHVVASCIRPGCVTLNVVFKYPPLKREGPKIAYQNDLEIGFCDKRTAERAAKAMSAIIQAKGGKKLPF